MADTAASGPEPADESSAPTAPVPKEGGAARRSDPEERSREAASTAIVAPSAEAPDSVPGEGVSPDTAPHAADAGAVDVAMLRRGWNSLMEHLQSSRQAVLKAALESSTVASYDGTTLELAFPPDRRFTVQKVQSKQDELRSALADLFGIRPSITCVVRESREPAGGPAVIELVDEEEPPSEEEALRRVQEMLGAQVAGEPESG